MSTRFTGPAQIYSGDIYTDSSVQEHPLGTLAVTDDGRSFRYCKAGDTALVAGKLQQAPAVVANHQNCAVTAAAAIGDTSVTFTLGATLATANQYAEGLLIVNDANGEGGTYKIKSNPAVDSAGSMTVQLEDPIVNVALTTSSEVSLIPNPYNGVIVNPASASAAPVGVAVKNITAAQYGWIQTHGAVSCLNDSATAVGLGLAPSAAVAGAVKTNAATLSPVGYALQAGVTTEYRVIFLTID